MASSTDISPVYSLRPGYATKRSVLERLGRSDLIERPRLQIVVTTGTVLMIAGLLLLPLLPLALWLPAVPLILSSPIAMVILNERRLRRIAARIRADRLCLGCGYTLRGAHVDDHGAGRCPECGRAFNVKAYEEPASRRPSTAEAT